MIVLMAYSISKVLIGALLVSITLLLIYIAYKKLLVKLGKGQPAENDYCVLYTLEKNPVDGEMEIYFTTKTPRKVTIELLNEDLSTNRVLAEGEFSEGGHIVRYDSLQIPDGEYFYCLRTDNQKTSKKITIKNS